MKKQPQILIIGSGMAGLAAAKTALESDLVPVVLEKEATLGGMWRPISGLCWNSMQANLSRYTCMFSDFPWDKDALIFPTAQQIYQYLSAYARTFELEQYIRFGAEVLSVKRVEDLWEIRWQEGDRICTHSFQFVIIATGIFSQPYIPEIKGLQDFKKPVIHSKFYKSPHPYQNKTVLVVGGAFSGTEIAADIAEITPNVLHVMSNQLPWIIPRYVRPYPEANYTLPLDWVFYNRSARKQPEEVIIKSTDDHKKSNNYLAWVCDEQQQMHSSLKKDGQSQLPSFITISDLYPKNVANGKIQIKKDKISCFSQDAVVFNNGAEVKIDAVVFCTGYRLNLKFLDQTILKELEFSSTDLFQPMILYKSTFHPNLPNMAFVGVYRGTYFAAVELQARWINLVFSGRLPPPSQEELRKGIEGERQVRGQEPRPQFPHPDYVGFADDIARKIGIFPDIKEMEDKQPQLHEKFYKGPVLPSHYRLIGLDAKPDLASQQIAEVNQWIKHRRKESQSNQHLLKTVVRALVGGAGLFVTYQITNRILPAITPSMGR